jgi:hypothetical protein
MSEWPDRVPDGIVPLVGFRMWQVVEEPGGPVFLPLTNGSREWVGATHRWVTASCRLRGHTLFVSPDGELVHGTEHEPPDEACGCGFYAMKRLDRQLLAAARTAIRATAATGSVERFVLGRVELSGKIVEHDLGYRAERARIVELIPLRGQEGVEALGRQAGIAVRAPVRGRRDRTVRRRMRQAFVIRGLMKSSPPPLPSPAERRNDVVIRVAVWGGIAAIHLFNALSDRAA